MVNISLKQLIADGWMEGMDHALYGDSCCVFRAVSGESIKMFHEAIELTVRMDTMVFLLVEQGTLTMVHDFQRETIGPGSLFAAHQGKVVRVEHVSTDFRCWFVFLERKVLDSLNVSLQKAIPYMGRQGESPAILLNAKQMEYARQLLQLLFLCISYQGSSIYYHEAVRAHIAGLVYFLLGILTQKMQADDSVTATVKSRDEEYFQRFMRLLQRHFRSERKTTFYAREMCLSPKYLSTIVRRFSGRGPSEWIDECVIVEAKRLLKFTDRSIQEVAFELNFPTQSFFGRYFKSHTGLSPKAFKQQ